MTIGYILIMAVIKFDWLNDVTDLCHNKFATTASLDKTAFYFLFV